MNRKIKFIFTIIFFLTVLFLINKKVDAKYIYSNTIKKSYDFEKQTYTITYNLDGGILQNPVISYQIDSPEFYVQRPTKEGYVFLGWSGTEINSLVQVVTIKKGSTGNREYTAHWEKEGLYAKLYDTTGDSIGETLVINNNSSFTHKGELITDFNNVEINEYQESKWHDDELGIYQTPWNGLMESDNTRMQYKNITTVIIKGNIKPKNMSMWFFGFPLKSIQGIGKIDTSECTNMYGLFKLSNDAIITSLNLYSWDTSKVENMIGMFEGCKKLEKIYVSNKFVVNETTMTGRMFNNCLSLVGGSGTVYDSTKTNGVYARIDTLESPGYFTNPYLFNITLANIKIKDEENKADEIT